MSVLHQHHHQVIVSIVQPDASACQLAKRLNGIQGFQHTAFHLHIRACHHGTDNLRERDCRPVIIIKLESGDSIGVLVDAVEEVVTLEQSQIEKVAYDSKDKKANFINGVGKDKDRLISLLDVNATFTDKDGQ